MAERKKEVIINIMWEGPFSFEEVSEKNDTKKDRGVYQIYGPHPVYGHEALLYIGKTERQTFCDRLKQHHDAWLNLDNRSKIAKFYVGRLIGKDTPNNQEWEHLIDIAEQLLIFYHYPAANVKSITGLSDDKKFYDDEVQIFNWGIYRDLLPEVSGRRQTYRAYNEINGIGPFSDK